MTTSVYIGIDPGVSGGISVIYSDGEVTSRPMPENEYDIYSILNGTNLDGPIHRPTPRFAVIEKVGGYIPRHPGAAHGGQPGSHMFKFGRNVGVLIGIMMALHIKFEEIPPQTWQKHYQLQQPQEKQHWKNTLKEEAQRLFPDLKVTLKTADSLLLAEYCRRMVLGRL